jgi:hypothetical protein
MEEEVVSKVCSPKSQGIRDKFPGHPRIHFCNGCFEVYEFFYSNEECFVKNNRGTSLIACVFI